MLLKKKDYGEKRNKGTLLKVNAKKRLQFTLKYRRRFFVFYLGDKDPGEDAFFVIP